MSNPPEETLFALLLKIWPPIAGALLSLRWMPEGSTWTDRAVSGFSSVSLALIAGPAAAELAGVESARVRDLVLLLVGLFGLLIAGQVVKAIKETDGAALFRDFWSRWFGGK